MKLGGPGSHSGSHSPAWEHDGSYKHVLFFAFIAALLVQNGGVNTLGKPHRPCHRVTALLPCSRIYQKKFLKESHVQGFFPCEA